MTISIILEKSPHINISKEDGTTPLLLAIEVSHEDIFKLLRHKGQDPNKCRQYCKFESDIRHTSTALALSDKTRS